MMSKLLMFVAALSFASSMAASVLQKRNAEDSLNRLSDELHRGNVCLTDDGCSFFEYCDLSTITDPHCKLQTWVVAVVVIAIIAFLLTLGISCICCPFCCLYNMCKK